MAVVDLVKRESLRFKLLAALADLGAATQMRAACKAVGYRSASASQALITMKQNGLVELTNAPKGRTPGIWHLTAKGRGVFADPDSYGCREPRRMPDRAAENARATYNRTHPEHVARQLRMGLKLAEIDAPLRERTGKRGEEAA
jgi:DNA-binding MarR family transcriptional regulator